LPDRNRGQLGRLVLRQIEERARGQGAVIAEKSTGKQGKSGLGIEAQREAIARFAAAEGRKLVAEFVEVETGKGSDALDRRPKLAEALAKARKAKAPSWWRSCAVCPAMWRSSLG
jgi:hypothetical protein